MSDRVAAAAESGNRRLVLSALVESLTEAIQSADVPAVPELAARLVDVLKRIGGSDPSALLWLRGGLAPTVDRLVEIQGETDDQGKPLREASALAPTVRQLVVVVEALERLPKRDEEVAKVDELAARRRARSGVARSSTGRRRSG